MNSAALLTAIAWPLSLQYMQAWEALALFAAVAFPFVWLGTRSWAGISRSRRWMSVSLRLIVLGLLVLALAGARWNRQTTDVEVIVIQDASRSAANVQIDGETEPARAIQRYLQTAADIERQNGDRVGLIRFDADAWVEALPGPKLLAGAGAAHTPLDGTNVAGAIQLALATLSPDAMHRLVLLWDGNSSAGDLDAALSAAAAQKVPIDVVPYRYRISNEVALEQVIAPGWTRKNEPFTVEVRLRSANAQPVSGRLHLLENGVEVTIGDGTRARQITLRPGTHVERITLPGSDGEGARRFEAWFEADADVAGQPADTMASNNAAQAITFIRGVGSVLYVDNAAGGQGHLLSDALAQQGIRVQVIRPDAFPRSTLELQEYESVVLANVPRGIGGFDELQQDILTRWVRDMGGGLVTVGGPDAYGAGGWIGSRLETILPIDCDIPSEVILPASALMIVIDHSGSMFEGVAGTTTSKQQIANESAILAIQSLSARDYVGVVAFDDAATLVVPLAQNTAPQSTANAVRAISPAGGTNIAAGLEGGAVEMIRLGSQRASLRHIILLSDGQSASSGYDHLLQRLRDEGITLSTIGVGDSVDDQVMSYLANGAGGRYYRVADPRLLPQIFTREARQLKRPLIEEEPFLPRITGGYSPLMTGIEAVPPLGGIVLATPKRDPRVTVAMWTPKGMPLLAHWQTGLGQVASFTSDAQARWAAEWLPSPVYGKFWSQVVRAVSRSMNSGDYDLRTEVDGDGRGRIIVTTLGDGEGNNPWTQMAAVVAGPGGQPSQQVRLQQSGPGRWTGEFSAIETGTYTAVVRHSGGADGGGLMVSGLVVSGSTELNDLASNEAAIRQVAQRTGGRVLEPFDPTTAKWFTRDGLTQAAMPLPIWDRLLLAAMIVFLLDVAIRRIAIGPKELRAGLQRVADWIRSFTQPGARAKTAGAGTGGVEAFRKVKEGQRDEPPRQAPTDYSASAGKGDVLSGLGAAGGAEPRRSAPTAQPTSEKPAAASASQEAQGMSALLAAKQRARKRMSGDESANP